MDLKTKTREELLELINKNSLNNSELELIQKHLEVVSIARYSLYSIRHLGSNEEWFAWLHILRSLSDKRFHVVRAQGFLRDELGNPKMGTRVFKTLDDATICYMANKTMAHVYFKHDLKLNILTIYDGSVLHDGGVYGHYSK